MKELLGSGATIIFVSHNKQAVRDIRKRAIWLDKGAVRMDGPLTAWWKNILNPWGSEC